MKESELGTFYNNGETICSEGDAANSMYVIQSGKVEVIKKTDRGEVTLATLNKGDFFGEMSLFDHRPRSATVKAVGDARILKIDKKGFFARASEDPSFAFNILEGMTKRIRSLDDELSELKQSRRTT
jgi:CRP/FNR family cyclic AMP-dependent transcriptional regulator